MRFGWGRAVVLIALADVVFGCQCRYEPPCARIHKTAAIFIGRVRDAGKDGDGPFRFVVEEGFKGVDRTTAEVEVLPGLCVAGYKPGRKYLVLANKYPDGALFSGDCTGTVPVEVADDDIRLIRSWSRGVPVQQLQGRIAENTEDSMVAFMLDMKRLSGLAGVDVTAVKDGKAYTTKTDGQGAFRIEVPEPGRYALSAVYPGHSGSKSEYDFSVEPGACAEHNIGMWTDSKISGVVLDPVRHAVAGIPIEMIPFSSDRSFYPLTAVTDASGSFHFSKVPQGEYLVGVNLHGLSSKLPYEPRFYPGVTRREQAAPVRVGGPETLPNISFQIGNRLPTRQIRVTVVWSDGRPVTNASVNCESSRSDDRRFIKDWISRYTNPAGEAICEVLTDRDYQVDADRRSWSASSRPVQPIATRQKMFVAAGTTPATARITVDRVNDISDKERPSDMSRFNDRDR